MTNGNDGAFATADVYDNGFITNGQCGLTKREYFAAMALQGLLADDASGYSYISAANDAVRFSDALIDALNKEAE